MAVLLGDFMLLLTSLSLTLSLSLQMAAVRVGEKFQVYPKDKLEAIIARIKA